MPRFLPPSGKVKQLQDGGQQQQQQQDQGFTSRYPEVNSTRAINVSVCVSSVVIGPQETPGPTYRSNADKKKEKG
jgi:hypothetical protein